VPVQIDEITTTVEVQGDAETAPAPPSQMVDEVAERIRQERFKRDSDRLRADGYAD
jgi:hypothetical protein